MGRQPAVLRVFGFFFVLLLLAVPASAAINTGVVHIGVDNTGPHGISNMLGYLGGDSRFSNVGNIDVDVSGVPSLSQLSVFDSILVVTGNRAGALTGGGLGTQLGNILDDYVVAGGRVVFSAFSGKSGIGVDGQILALAPYVSTGSSNAPAGSLNMGTANTAHFVFDNVSSFQSAHANDIALSANGILLASYHSGTLGVLTTLGDSVMLINGFPATQGNYSNGSDFGLVFANALAGPGTTANPEPASLAIWRSGW